MCSVLWQKFAEEYTKVQCSKVTAMFSPGCNNLHKLELHGQMPRTVVKLLHLMQSLYRGSTNATYKSNQRRFSCLMPISNVRWNVGALILCLVQSCSGRSTSRAFPASKARASLALHKPTLVLDLNSGEGCHARLSFPTVRSNRLKTLCD